MKSSYLNLIMENVDNFSYRSVSPHLLHFKLEDKKREVNY